MAWTISRDMRKRMEAVEIWFYGRMIRTLRTTRMTNLEVKQRAGVSRKLMTVIKKRHIKFLGHLL